MIRPEPARWFEILVAHPDVMIALEELARSGCAEFDEGHCELEPPEMASMTRLLGDFRALATRYRPYLPTAQLTAPPRDASAAALLKSSFERLRSWAAEVDPSIETLRAVAAELETDAIWERALGELEAEGIPPDALAGDSTNLEAALFCLPPHAPLELHQGRAAKQWTSGSVDYLLWAGDPAALHRAEEEVGALQGHRVVIPQWLLPLREGALAALRQRIEAREREASALKEAIAAAAAKNNLAEALGDIARSAWYMHCIGALEDESVVCRIRGWTDDGARLEQALERSTARALIHFPSPAADVVPPLVLRNPVWARPFELFTRLLGMPARDSADPSALLALIAPLIFGYMFGDVGQGLLLVCAGALAGRRWEPARMLVAGGLVASVFGLAFGSVFSMEDGIDPLWLRPLDHPLEVLTVPLLGGGMLLVLGSLIGAVEARWSGRLKSWLLEDGCPLMTFIGAAVALRYESGFVLIAAGLAGSVLGNVIAQRGLRGLATASAEYIEKTMQLFVNAVSFVRIGAFALAHAGLSSAVMSMSSAADSVAARLLILALGNALIMVLEVMAVSIQTTRLVLFEFFVRFFEARGREFRPAAPPSIFFQEKPHEAKS